MGNAERLGEMEDLLDEPVTTTTLLATISKCAAVGRKECFHFLPSPFAFSENRHLRMSTPRRVRHSAVGTNYETPTQTRNERRSSTPAENRRALASGGGGARERGTPVGRLLAAEGLPTRSPRKIRKATLVER